MALPFLTAKQKTRSNRGHRPRRADHQGHLRQRKGDTFTLQRFAVLDAPIYEKNLSVDVLAAPQGGSQA